MPAPPKNLWIAASDGDLNRVKELVEEHGMSPNAPDHNTYTPMHAAASYGHIELLDYLISRGGNVNIADEDGDTPLYTVESIGVAQYLIEHGATTDRRNSDGQSPEEYLEEDFPEVATYLRSLSSRTEAAPLSQEAALVSVVDTEMASAQDSEQPPTSLMSDVEGIMARAERDGTDPEVQLREAVERAVFQGMEVEQSWTSQGDEREAKRPRRENGES